MSQISIDVDLLGDLMLASRDCQNYACYFNTRTGCTEIVSFALVQAVLKNERGVLDHLSEEESLHAELVRNFYTSDDSHYTLLPQIDLITEFNWMTDFTYLFPSGELYEKLIEILDLSALLQKLEEIIKKSPEYFEMWVNFRNEKKVGEVTNILEQLEMTEAHGFRHVG